MGTALPNQAQDKHTILSDTFRGCGNAALGWNWLMFPELMKSQHINKFKNEEHNISKKES